MTLAYSGALDPQGWDNFLVRLTSASGGVMTHMFGQDFESHTNFGLRSAGFGPEFVDDFTSYYCNLNVLAKGVLDFPISTPLSYEQVVEEDRLVRTEFYRDWLRPQEDCLGGGGVVLFKENRRVFVMGGNIRRKDIEKLQRPWLSLMAHLAPHLRQALEIARVLAGQELERWALRASSSAAAPGCLVVNAHRRIIFANNAGNAMLEAGTAIRRDLQRRIRFADWSVDRQFQDALVCWNTHPLRQPHTFLVPDGVGFVCRTARLEPDELDSSPLRTFLGSGEACFFLTLSQREQDANLPARLRTQFHLTRRETDVALHLADGRTLEEIAQLQDVSVHTARNQLKAAMAKMEVRRQTDLVRIITTMRHGD
ncbi:helix-turn-helix transcriptional regulator [Devosia nitrariae]|uniref:LuxR family transcriptional regulator n=1 Tax=Devosia nitrariae TaxID=2071872 RepID=A0ABQ5VYX7_9HYPH|nr:helix-turn-helix transcriptional regulator [Devosia nitrariae]GLQ52822.1 LuxR family transcriptional regulator [Devosia nitrariae]